MNSTINYLILLLCLTSPENYHRTSKSLKLKKEEKVYDFIPDKFCPYIPPARTLYELVYENKDM